ncbi:MAG: membrane protein insertion efficiency factor YidD [Bacteroidota bacterium]
MQKFFNHLFVFVIRLYQYLISSWTPPSCRFYPSCSNYSIEAIKKHGTIRGLYLGLKRILRCRPGGGSGFDPVP